MAAALILNQQRQHQQFNNGDAADIVGETEHVFSFDILLSIWPFSDPRPRVQRDSIPAV